MGYALEWQAFRGASAQAVCDDLGLKRTGQREDVADSPLVGVELPSGWYVVVANNFSRYGKKVDPAQLSREGELVVCCVEERVGYSSAEEWKHGCQLWSIIHDAASGDLEHLETTGDLPPEFASIRDRKRSEQQAAGGRKAQVDYYFDIPLDVAKLIAGFAHDEDPVGVGEEPFEVLEAIGGSKRGRISKKLTGVALVLLLFCGLPLVVGVVAMLLLFAWVLVSNALTGR